MLLAFYLAKHAPLLSLDRAIDKLSGGLGYSHCELLFDNGLSFSSSPRDPIIVDRTRIGGSGVRFKNIDYVAQRKQWNTTRVHVSRRQQSKMLQHCDRLVREGHGYDYLGVLRFAFPGLPQSRRRYFCSEVIVEVLRAANVIDPVEHDWQISPNDLALIFGVERPPTTGLCLA